MKLLLDTCTFLWIATDDSRLSAEARSQFIDGSNEIYLSALSAWEIGIKSNLGRLTLPDRASRFVPEARARFRIEPLPMNEDAALAVSRLPHLHRDPFDRGLISQAILHGMTLLTPDETIAQYPVKTLW